MKLVVDKESLVSVADAIREKGNTNDSLEFPNGFVNGINAIASGGGGLTVNGVVAGTEPSGDVVIGAVTPRQGALVRCSNITSLTLDGTIFASGSVQPFTYLGGMFTLTLKNTSGAMPALAIAYASNGLVLKIIGSCATLSSNAFSGFGANHRDGVPIIYVPWSEDDSMNANAPWGATKATIKYNTTYDANDNPIVSEV